MKSNLKAQKKNFSTIRPLLSISRFETGKFCDFWELPIYPDLSNKKVHFLRNRVRKQLLPTLKLFFNSRIEAVLLQFAEIIEAEDHYMNQTTKKLLKKLILTKIETKKLVSTLSLPSDNSLHKVMQTQRGAKILTNTSLQSHFSNQGSLAPKLVIIRCHSKKWLGDLKPLQPIDFSAYTTFYTPIYTKNVTRGTPTLIATCGVTRATPGPAAFLPHATLRDRFSMAATQALGGEHGVKPSRVSNQEITCLSITPTYCSLKVLTSEGGKQVMRHIPTFFYPFDYYPRGNASKIQLGKPSGVRKQLDQRCTVFDQFIQITYQICESSKVGYVGTKGQFYWSSFSGCRKRMVGVKNKLKKNQKPLGWKIHNPLQDNFCQFHSSCKKTAAFVKSAAYSRREVRKPISTRSFLFLPSGQRQQNFFLLLKYKKKRKPTALQSTRLQSSIPYKFTYSGEISACNLLFTSFASFTSRVRQGPEGYASSIQLLSYLEEVDLRCIPFGFHANANQVGSKKIDKQDFFFLPLSFTNPRNRLLPQRGRQLSHKVNKSDDFLSLALSQHISFSDSSTPKSISGVHGVQEKVSTISVPVINFVKNLLNDIENNRKHASQLTLTSDASKKVDEEQIESRRNSNQVFKSKDNGKTTVSAKSTSLIRKLFSCASSMQNRRWYKKKIQTTSLVGTNGIASKIYPFGVSNEVTTYSAAQAPAGVTQKETECALKTKMIACSKITSLSTYRNRNGDVLHSLFLFPRFSVPLGISLWMWNRKFGIKGIKDCNVVDSRSSLGQEGVGKSNPWSKKSKTGIECALLGTSVKEKILPNSRILSHNNTEWKFYLDPRLTLEGGSSQRLELQKNPMKNSRNDIEGKSGSNFFLQTVSGLNVSQNQKIKNIIIHNLFLRFHHLENKKKNIYWPIVISFLPIALQRRVVKLFLINQNWKKIRYSQIDNFLEIKKKPFSTFF